MLIYIFSFVVLLSNNRVFLFSGPLYVPADMSVELQIVPPSLAAENKVKTFSEDYTDTGDLILKNKSPLSLIVSDITSILLISEGAFMES